MGFDLSQLRQVGEAGKTARDIHEVIKNQDDASQNLGQACNNYLDNPTSENQEKVHRAHEDWYHVPAQGVGEAVGGLAPKGLGDIANGLGLNPIPQGLKDAQDSSANPYQPSKGYENAIEYLRQQSGRKMSDLDRARCDKAGEYFREFKKAPPPPPRRPARAPCALRIRRPGSVRRSRRSARRAGRRRGPATFRRAPACAARGGSPRAPDT